MGVLHLHIGMGRCGSTSIQALAARHRQTLRERGLDYPSGRDMGFPDEPDGAPNGDRLFLASRTENPEPVFQRIADYAAASALPCLISSEGLFTANHVAMASFRQMLEPRGVELRIIAYVREQTGWIVSRWAQGVKMDWTRTLNDCLERPPMGGSLYYAERFAELANAYGEAAITPRLFDAEHLIGGDVRIDLFAQAGVDVAELVAGEERRNASPSVEETLAMRLLNEAGWRGDKRGFLAFARRWAERQGVTFTPELYRLGDPEAFARLRRRFTGRNRAFRRQWLSDGPKPLFAEAFPLDYQPLTPAALAPIVEQLAADYRREPADPTGAP